MLRRGEDGHAKLDTGQGGSAGRVRYRRWGVWPRWGDTMFPRGDGEIKPDNGGEMDVGVQVIIGFLLVVVFSGLVWLLFNAA
jgi:hypothetical protein